LYTIMGHILVIGLVQIVEVFYQLEQKGNVNFVVNTVLNAIAKINKTRKI
jgi:hypothetical protein